MVDKVQSLQFGATPSPLDLVHGTVGELKQPKANTKTDKSGLPVPEYNTDTLGAGTDVPENPSIQRSETPANVVKSFVSGVGFTGRDYYASAREKFLYDVDTGFDPKAGYDNFVSIHGLLSDAEMNRLLTAPSEAAQQDRIAYILDERDRMKAIGDNPISGIVGSVLDVDLPVALAGGVIGVGAKAAGATRAASRVVSAASATGIMGGIIAGTADGTQLTNLDHGINLVAAGVGGAFALTKPRPTTTPAPSTTARGVDTATPSPLPVDSTTITRSTVDTPEKAVPTKVEIPVDVHLDNIAEELQEAQGIIDRIRSGEESNNLAYGEKLDAIQARYAKVDTDKTITPANTLTGTIVGTHGSKVDNLEFKNNFDREANIESVGYHDNVFGDDVVYLGEVGDSTVSWSPRNPEEAADMRMPYYENEYTVQTTFKKAFVLDPSSAKGLANALGDGAKNGEAVVKYLRSQGYDGLIVRDMGAMSKPVDHTKVDSLSYYSGLDNELLQEQVIAFNPESVKVVGKSSDVNPQELQRTLTDSGVYGSVPKSIDTKGTPPSKVVVDTRTLDDTPEKSVREPLADYSTKVQVNKGKGSVRLLEDSDTPRFQAKFKINPTDNTLVFDGAKIDPTLPKGVDVDAYEYGIKYANDNNLTFSIKGTDQNTKRIIKELEGRGYNIEGGTVKGAKSFDGESITTSTGKSSTVEPTPQTLDDMIEEEITSISTPTPGTVASIDLGGGGKVNFKLVNDADMPEKIKNSWVVRSEIAAKMQSVADEMFYMLRGDLDDPMSRLVSSAVYTLGDDVESLAHAIQAEGAVRLQEFEMATEKAAKELYGTSGILGRIVGKEHTKNQRKAFNQIYEGLQRVDQQVLTKLDDGVVVTDEDVLKLIDELDTPQVIKDAMVTYTKSGYATNVYDHMKRVGLLDDDSLKGLPRRSTYVPLQHDYSRVKNLIDAGGEASKVARHKAIAVFFGEQIQKTYPSLIRGITRLDGSVVRLDAETLGNKFISNMRDRVDQSGAVRTTGVARNDLHDLMVAHGIPTDEAAQLVLKVAAKRETKNGVKNLRERIKWDWFKTGHMPDGSEFRMTDLIDEHQFSKLNEYNRRISKRVALAKYGFKDRAALDEGKTRVLDNLPEGMDRGKAAKSLDNVINAVIGNPVGEAIPEAMRSLNAVAGSFLLAWSGLYNTVEAAVQITQVGLLRSVPHLLPALKPMLKGMNKYTVSEAKGMRDIITGMAMDEGRWKNIFTQYSDDFNVGNSFHEGVQYMGQSARFLNASEFVKRWQIGMYAGVVTKTIGGAAKGSAKDIKFLKENMRMHDELIQHISTEWNKHGDNINAWDADVRIGMEQKVLHEMGNHAISLQHGDTPAFLAHTSWGKMILPFMTFVWGAHNRLLRRTYVRDGALAVATVLAVQFPLAMMVSGLKRASSGEEPYDLDDPTERKEFIQSLLPSMSGLGVFSIPMDIILSEGRNLGSVAAFAPIGKTMALASAVTSEEGATFRDIKENTPLNVPLGISMLMAVLEEDE